MDVMDRPVISTSDTKHYRRHSTEFKLALVKQTLQSGASVARIAREHGVNANQVFGWRKLYRDGLLGASSETAAAMLPATVVVPDSRDSDAPCPSQSKTGTASVIRLECAKGSLIIEGVPDSDVLDRVLDRLLR
jgi:transposase